jgi:hypothetical protein
VNFDSANRTLPYPGLSATILTISTAATSNSNLDLVENRRDGNRAYFSANREHPLFIDIHNLVIKTAGLVDVLKNALSTNEKIRLAFIFG